MNIDTIKGSWTEIKGAIRSKWGRLNDDEIEEAKGDLDQLVGKLQKTYGYAKDKAELEYAEFKNSLKDRVKKL